MDKPETCEILKPIKDDETLVMVCSNQMEGATEINVY